MNRRDFLRLVGLGSVAAVVAPMLPAPVLPSGWVDRETFNRIRRHLVSIQAEAEFNSYYNEMFERMAKQAAETLDRIRMEAIRDSHNPA